MTDLWMDQSQSGQAVFPCDFNFEPWSKMFLSFCVLIFEWCKSRSAKERSRWQRSRKQSSSPSIETLKIHLQVERFTQNSYWVPAKDFRHLKRQENTGPKEKEKEGIKTGPAPQGGSCEGQVPTPWEVSSPAGRLACREGELWSLRGESSNWFVESKMENNLYRGSGGPPCAPQPETLLCWWRWGSGAEAQTLELGPRERTRVKCGKSLKRSGCGNWGCTRKKPGPTREARHNTRRGVGPP